MNDLEGSQRQTTYLEDQRRCLNRPTHRCFVRSLKPLGKLTQQAVREMARALQQLIKGVNRKNKDGKAIGACLKLAHGWLSGNHLHCTDDGADAMLQELATIGYFGCTTTKNQQD